MFSGNKLGFALLLLLLWSRIMRVLSIAAFLLPAAAFSGEWQNRASPWTDEADSRFGVSTHSLVVVPGEGLFAVGDGSLHVSRDDGITWTPVTTPAGSIAATVNARARPEVLYATNVTAYSLVSVNQIQVLQSIDAGRTWTNLASGTGCFRLALDPAGVPAYCFDAGYGASFHPILFRSRDAGHTWQRVDSDVLHASINSVAAAPGRVHVTTPGSVQYSSDGGDTWQTSPTMPPGATAQIIVDPSRPATVYVGSHDGLYKSQDAGQSWAHIAFAFPITAVAIDPFDGALYVGFQGGIARSPDGGATWQSMSDGLTDRSITLIEFSGDKLYAVSTAGLSVCPGKDCTDMLQPLAQNVIEFYHAGLNHFFYTANAGEQAWLDAGGAGGGWVRTGLAFRNGGPQRVCRFYGSLNPGPNSHFYTVVPTECDGLKELQTIIPVTEKRWNYEGLDFFSAPPIGVYDRTCPAGTIPVYRSYNNGFARGIDSNHRLTPSLQAIQEVVASGWIDEGIMMCAGQ
jgi:photosystem II stability/assembly factor-like uncharacterized protein